MNPLIFDWMFLFLPAFVCVLIALKLKGVENTNHLKKVPSMYSYPRINQIPCYFDQKNFMRLKDIPSYFEERIK